MQPKQITESQGLTQAQIMFLPPDRQAFIVLMQDLNDFVMPDMCLPLYYTFAIKARLV